jgi:photosystem II stability/assembly factor-like uncharacterized protein
MSSTRLNFSCESLYQRLDELNVLLCARGFVCGPDRWIAVQDLLFHQFSRLKPPETQRELCLLLAPIFCSTPEDQSTFYELFEHWCQKDQATLEHLEIIKIDENSHPPPPSASIITKLWFWRTLFLCVLLIGIRIITLPDDGKIIDNDLGKTQEQSIPETNELSTEPEQKVKEEVDQSLERYAILPRTDMTTIEPTLAYLKQLDYLFYFALVCPFIMLFFLHLYQRANQQHTLKHEKGHGKNPLVHLQLKLGKSMPFALGDFTKKLRRSVLVSTRSLDMPRTIKATLRNAGLFVPIHKMRHEQPNYVVLVDKDHSASQSLALGDVLVQRLHDEHLHVSHYYFSGDPRWCFRRKRDEIRSYNIKSLITLHPDARLIIIGDGKRLFSELNQKIHPWVKSFDFWKQRTWLTTQPQPWGYQQSQLAEYGFAIAPLHSHGISAIASWLQKENLIPKANSAAPWFGGLQQQQFPKELNKAKKWLRREKPKTKKGLQQFQQMLVNLQDYLGDDGFYLLTTCAAYPEINGNLTIALEQKLFPQASPQSREKRLLAISVLPWCQKGFMPSYIRQELLYRLTYAEFSHISEIYRDLFLLGSSTKSDIALRLPDVYQTADTEKHIKEKAEAKTSQIKKNKAALKNNALSQDQLLIKVIKGRRSRLDYVLPDFLSQPINRISVGISANLQQTLLTACTTLAIFLLWPYGLPFLLDIQTARMLQENKDITVIIGRREATKVLADTLKENLSRWGFTDIVFDDLPENLWLAGGDGGFYTSRDGADWIVYRPEGKRSFGRALIRDNKWTVPGDGLLFQSSTQGESWKMTELPIKNQFIGTGYSADNNTWILVGKKGAIVKSIDKKNWQSIDLKIKQDLIDITYSTLHKRWVVVGNKGTILYSNNGVDWKKSVSNYKVNLYKVWNSEDQGSWYAVGEKSTVLFSEDGINWTQEELKLNLIKNIELSSITGALGHIIAVGKKGVMITKVGKAPWKVLPRITNQTLFDVFYSEEEDEWLSVGKRGTLLKSSDGINWIEINSPFSTRAEMVGIIRSQLRSTIKTTSAAANAVDTIATQLKHISYNSPQYENDKKRLDSVNSDFLLKSQQDITNNKIIRINLVSPIRGQGIFRDKLFADEQSIRPVSNSINDDVSNQKTSPSSNTTIKSKSD